MPKIIIKEYDKTKAVGSEYENFAVVVPGFVKSGNWKDDAGNEHAYGTDENNKSVFDDNDVYECNSLADFTKYIGKVEPSDSTWAEAVACVTEATPATLTENAFNTKKAAGNLFKATAKESTDTKIGYLRDSNYIYTAADTWVSTNLYAEILPEKRGSDKVTGAHYGNQIAHELLGLGYTVLFKQIKSSANEITKDPFWEALKDKASYDFRYLIGGVISTGSATSSVINIINNCMIKVADFINTSTADDTGRGDCTALCEIDSLVYANKDQGDAINAIASATNSITASPYAAIFAPYVTYSLANTGFTNCTFPAAFHYLACAAKARETFAEWYAVAGYSRGISNYVITGVGCKFGEKAINALEPRYNTGTVSKSVNIIAKIKNQYYLWGNRTAKTLGTKNTEDGDLKAQHFLNIRQLCSTLKKEIYIACRRFTFDPNSDLLWINFCNAIRPTLESMKADQGIADYKFVKVKNSQKATLTAKVRIVPIEAVEDFDISVMLEDDLTGTVIGEE